ncbi:glutaredoxin family protein [Candidatus Berkelbacteria bacterium]|nr:glutaredoxin family protein [Candidatus Berkelbacteria bacterium]
MSKVTIYSTHTCPYCAAEKDFLTEKKIKFTNIYVDENPKAVKEMVAKSGQMGVPVTIIKEGKNEELVVGFNQAKLEKLLNIR